MKMHPVGCILCLLCVISRISGYEDSCFENQVALLIVGHSRPPSFKKHAEEMMNSLVKPYNADIFAVTDVDAQPVFADMNAAQLLPFFYGSNLKMIGLLARNSLDVTAYYPPFDQMKNVLVGVDPPNLRDATIQWFKLRECWKLMEQYEESNGKKYDIVVKLRFDCTPRGEWNFCNYSSVFTEAHFQAIHACTDHIFWGLRDVMKIATYDVYPAISDYFAISHPNPLQRQFSVSALLNSLRSVYELVVANWWKHYNKVGTLPYLELNNCQHKNTIHYIAKPLHPQDNEGAYKTMIQNLEEALNVGLEYIDPSKTEKQNKGYQILPGLLSNKYDNAMGSFNTEKDFLVFLIMHNITVCDLGAGTNSVIYKGNVFPRPSANCRKYY